MGRRVKGWSVGFLGFLVVCGGLGLSGSWEVGG